MGQVAEGYLESPSEVPIESDHHLSCLVHPSSRHGVDGFDGDAVGTRNSAEVRGGPWCLLVRDRRNHSNSARPTHHQG